MTAKLEIMLDIKKAIFSLLPGSLKSSRNHFQGVCGIEVAFARSAAHPRLFSPPSPTPSWMYRGAVWMLMRQCDIPTVRGLLAVHLMTCPSVQFLVRGLVGPGNPCTGWRRPMVVWQCEELQDPNPEISPMKCNADYLPNFWIQHLPLKKHAIKNVLKIHEKYFLLRVEHSDSLWKDALC